MNNKLNTFLLLGIIVIASFFRLWQISSNPVSLFGDELDLGYHAYSILATGKDYMGNFMPVHFHSLAEWRTPLYLYSAVPTVALFGISPLGVRLPAAIFGILGILGIYLVTKEILSFNAKPANFHPRALLAALILALSPWHIQYSRAGFEVTALLAFLLFGIYFFFRSLRLKGNGLWISVLFFCFTPWIYSTAKLFTPLFLLLLFVLWFKELLRFPKKEIIFAFASGVIVGLPIVYSTFFGGGAQRAGYVSVFTDPITVNEIGYQRTRDILFRGDAILGAKYTFADRFFHNKFVLWAEKIVSNIYSSYSLNFLFIKGDINLRHSVGNVGEFYKVEIIGLIAGLIFFFGGSLDKKLKILILFWLLAGVLPAAVTRDGGNHATRLILILPPLIFLISFGILFIYKNLKSYWKYVFTFAYSLVFLINITFYLHSYYIHYPWDSERWWHSGFRESFQTIKEMDKNYDKVIISMMGEPAWIFFAGWYQYPPKLWQENFPIGNDEFLKGFGNISHTGKFYFGNFEVPGEGIYDLGKYIDEKTLYLAVAKEIGANLILEPERTPSNLILIKSIPYPSGEPAYYLFSGK